MANVQQFGVASFDTAKVSGVPITATAETSPQTVVTMTTPSLPIGKYMISYAFQATYGAKDRALFYRMGGTYGDAKFFSYAPGVNEALHINNSYGFPKDHAGGPIVLSVEMYDPLAEVVCDFADVVVQRVG